jgi:hypothetical protein
VECRGSFSSSMSGCPLFLRHFLACFLSNGATELELGELSEAALAGLFTGCHLDLGQPMSSDRISDLALDIEPYLRTIKWMAHEMVPKCFTSSVWCFAFFFNSGVIYFSPHKVSSLFNLMVWVVYHCNTHQYYYPHYCSCYYPFSFCDCHNY